MLLFFSRIVVLDLTSEFSGNVVLTTILVFVPVLSDMLRAVFEYEKYHTHLVHLDTSLLTLKIFGQRMGER